MKTYLSLAIAAVAVVGLVSWAAMAQTPATCPAGKHEPIKLTDEQKAKLKDIFKGVEAKIDGAETMGDVHKAVREAHERIFKEVLTAQQQERVKAFGQHFRQRGEQMREKCKNMTPEERQACREKMMDKCCPASKPAPTE